MNYGDQQRSAKEHVTQLAIKAKQLLMNKVLTNHSTDSLASKTRGPGDLPWSACHFDLPTVTEIVRISMTAVLKGIL